MANLRSLYQTNAPLVLNRAVDRSITLTDLDPTRRNNRIVLLQAVERMKADLLASSLAVNLKQSWVYETPSGTMNSSNTTFTLSQTPDLGTLTLVHNGRDLVRVSSGAVAGQYSVSGLTITVGLAPASGDELPAQYQVA